MAIDPKGFIGDPAFEFTAFLHNPSPRLLNTKCPEEMLARRLRHISNYTGINSKKLLDWLHVKTVLCWAWKREDGLKGEYYKRFIELVLALRDN